jgi:hypothetical protein
MGGYIQFIRTRDSEMLIYYCPTSTLTRTRTVSDDNDESSDIEMILYQPITEIRSILL